MWQNIELDKHLYFFKYLDNETRILMKFLTKAYKIVDQAGAEQCQTVKKLVLSVLELEVVVSISVIIATTYLG